MKKEYSKPEINTKAFAQFENVFTGCNKTGNHNDGCVDNGPEWPTSGSGNCAFDGNPSSN